VAAGPRPRQIKSLEWVKLRSSKAGPELFSRLTHPGRDRAATFHCRERVDGTIRPGGSPEIVGNRPVYTLNWAVMVTF
jgi:hypothetical protein